MGLPRLQIAQTPEGFAFGWNANAKPDIFPVSEDSLRELQDLLRSWRSAVQPRPWFAADPHSVEQHTRALRERLASLAPPEVRTLLAEEPAVALDDATQLPWELLTARAYRRLAAPSGTVEISPPLRGIAFVDPDGTLPGPAAAAGQVAECTSCSDWNTLCDLLETQTPAWLWLSASDVNGSLVLGNALLAPEDAKARALPRVPPLVFLQLFPVGQRAPEMRAWADFCAERGARVVLAQSYPTPPADNWIVQCVQALAAGRDLQSLTLAEGWVWFGQSNLRLVAPAQAATAASSLRPDFQFVVIAGPDQGRRFPIVVREGRQFHIGSSGFYTNEVELTDASVENRALRLDVTEGQLILRNLSGGSVAVNRLPLRQSLVLQGNETVQVGETWLCLERFRSFVAQTPTEQFELTWEGGRLELADAIVTIGRGEGSKLHVADPSVSRLHASLNARPDGYVLVPLSNNPTVVNGVVIDRERLLEAGDEVQLSETFRFQFRRLRS